MGNVIKIWSLYWVKIITKLFFINLLFHYAPPIKGKQIANGDTTPNIVADAMLLEITWIKIEGRASCVQIIVNKDITAMKNTNINIDSFSIPFA